MKMHNTGLLGTLKQSAYPINLRDEIYNRACDDDDMLIDLIDDEIETDEEETVCYDDGDNESSVDDDLIVAQLMQEMNYQEPIVINPLPVSTPIARA